MCKEVVLSSSLSLTEMSEISFCSKICKTLIETHFKWYSLSMRINPSYIYHLYKNSTSLNLFLALDNDSFQFHNNQHKTSLVRMLDEILMHHLLIHHQCINNKHQLLQYFQYNLQYANDQNILLLFFVIINNSMINLPDWIL
jgi:hypothetical protein